MKLFFCWLEFVLWVVIMLEGEIFLSNDKKKTCRFRCQNRLEFGILSILLSIIINLDYWPSPSWREACPCCCHHQSSLWLWGFWVKSQTFWSDLNIFRHMVWGDLEWLGSFVLLLLMRNIFLATIFEAHGITRDCSDIQEVTRTCQIFPACYVTIVAHFAHLLMITFNAFSGTSFWNSFVLAFLINTFQQCFVSSLWTMA